MLTMDINCQLSAGMLSSVDRLTKTTRGMIPNSLTTDPRKVAKREA